MTDVVVLVDAANVVGSRPDGWWRDRPAAAARLVEELAELPGTTLPAAGSFTGGRAVRVDVVLEGQACRGVPAGQREEVVVHHAPSSGDDTLALLAGPGILLVTADRELASRACERGAQVAGPRWFLRTLAAAD